jgi:hypothetical protein
MESFVFLAAQKSSNAPQEDIMSNYFNFRGVGATLLLLGTTAPALANSQVWTVRDIECPTGHVGQNGEAGIIPVYVQNGTRGVVALADLFTTKPTRGPTPIGTIEVTYQNFYPAGSEIKEKWAIQGGKLGRVMYKPADLTGPREAEIAAVAQSVLNHVSGQCGNPPESREAPAEPTVLFHRGHPLGFFDH